MSRVFRRTRRVQRETFKNAGVFGMYGIYRQLAYPLIGPQDRNPQIILHRCVIEHPLNIDGKIAFADGARGGHHIAGINRLIAEVERRYLRLNCEIEEIGRDA